MSSPAASPAEKSDPPKRKRGWRWLLQFRLRTLLFFTTVIAIWLGWWLHSARQQREAVAALRKAGSLIYYDFQYGDVPHVDPEARLPYWPTWLVDLLGVDRFAEVTIVCLHFEGTDADLAHLKDLTSLLELYLEVIQVTDAGLEHLKDLNALERLSLNKTEVTDAGLEHLKDLTSLQYLCLNDTHVTDAGLEHLKDLNALELLGLSHTQVTDVGLEHLRGLNALDWLFLDNTQVTDAGVAELQKSLPNCNIEH